MKTLIHRNVCSTILVPLALAVACAACGGEKQIQAKAPSAPLPVEPMGRTNVQPVSPSSVATTTHVSISPEILRACDIPDSDAYFAFDSSKLTSFDLTPLQSVATCFETGPLAGKHMRLVGHADPRGTPDYNLTLGQARADAVSSYLVGRGMRQMQIRTTSRGALDATGNDETGWAHDRRVDVILGD